MSRIALAFAAAALIATITSFHLWTELRAERIRTRALQQNDDPAALMAIAPSAGSALTQHFPAGPPSRATYSTAVGGRGTTVISLNGKQIVLDGKELMKDPEYREGLTMSLRSSLAQYYPHLARDMSLTPQQAKKMLDALARQQIASMSRAESESTEEQSAREQEMELRTLIGDAKYWEWQEYVSTMPARQRAYQLGATLESTGLALTDQQHRQLVGTIVETQKRQSEFAGLYEPPDSALRDPYSYTEKSQEEINRQVLESASTYLSQPQIEALGEMQNQELGITRAMIRASRLQADTGG